MMVYFRKSLMPPTLWVFFLLCCERGDASIASNDEGSLESGVLTEDTKLAAALSLEVPVDEIYTAFDSASWAITSRNLSSKLDPNRQSHYETFIRECNHAFFPNDPIKAARTTLCDENDEYRIEMNKHQPSSVYNYTNEGFKKTRAPANVYKLLRDLWEKNKDKSEPEWNSVTVYQNSWKHNTDMVHVSQEKHGGSQKLTDHIYSSVKPLLEEWTGHYLDPISLWGIRIYHNHSVLVPHVDRMPLIISAIIQVAQDVDKPWPLEVYGHDGKATNVTMEPGDMLFYESHSVIHGRPFPLHGSYYANCFVHFEINAPIDGIATYDPDLDIPPYIVPNSYWHDEWRKDHRSGWKARTAQRDDVRILVGRGDVAGLQKLYHDKPESLHAADANGWTALHEAIRSGKLASLKALLSFGIDKDLLTHANISPLHLARHFHGESHEVTRYLERIGAQDINLPHAEKLNDRTSDEL